MKTDLYTKVVLTIIAASLLIIIWRDISITPTANAQNSASFNSSRTIDVNIVSINGRSVNNILDVNVNNKITLDTPYSGLGVNVKNYSDFK